MEMICTDKGQCFQKCKLLNRIDGSECTEVVEEDNKWWIACVFHLATISLFKDFNVTNKIVAQMEHANVKSRSNTAKAITIAKKEAKLCFLKWRKWPIRNNNARFVEICIYLALLGNLEQRFVLNFNCLGI